MSTIESSILNKATNWLNSSIDEESKDKIRNLIENNPSELIDSFYQDLEFGTGGLRGLMGVGTNRMNVYTVAMATQGLANYLVACFPGEKIKVAITHDSRINNTRKAWVSAVGEVVEDCFKTEIKRIAAAPLRIDKAIAKAKRAANETCQVTGRKKARGKDLSLDGHHLFDRFHRPDLDDLHENILVVESSIHSQFHSWHGREGCEPKDFIKFLTEARSDVFDSANSRTMERFNSLTVRMTKLQKNFEGNHLRYR